MRTTTTQNTVTVDLDRCISCGKCVLICPKNIFSKNEKSISVDDVSGCIGCLACENSCPVNAIKVENRKYKKFFLARRCNNKCRMCFEHDVNVNEEYSFQEIIDSMNNQITGSEEMIILSGAEITTRKDLFKILKHIRRLNAKAQIFLPTNGRMFSYEDYVDKFVKLGLGDVKITVSILGFNPNTHDFITRVPGSYEQARQGILNLLKKGQNVNVNLTIQKSNFVEIYDLCNYYLAQGIRSIQLALVEPTGNASMNFESFIPKISNIMPIIQKALEIGKGKVRVKNIPKCMLGKYSELEFFATGNNMKKKVATCKNCIYDKNCFGIWKEYLDIYGDFELIPIIKKIDY